METLDNAIKNLIILFEYYAGGYISFFYTLHYEFFKNFTTYPFASGFILAGIVLVGIVAYKSYQDGNSNLFLNYWLLVFILPFLIPLTVFFIIYKRYEEVKQQDEAKQKEQENKNV